MEQVWSTASLSPDSHFCQINLCTWHDFCASVRLLESGKCLIFFKACHDKVVAKGCFFDRGHPCEFTFWRDFLALRILKWLCLWSGPQCHREGSCGALAYSQSKLSFITAGRRYTAVASMKCLLEKNSTWTDSVENTKLKLFICCSLIYSPPPFFFFFLFFPE